MNPNTNRFEPLSSDGRATQGDLDRLKRDLVAATGGLLRPNGEPVPAHWATFTVGELVEIKGYTFKVAYLGETALLFEPVGPVILEAAREAQAR